MMMMIGAAQSHHLNPANQTQNPPWDPFEEPTSPPVASSFSFSHLLDSLAALHRYHPSNNDSLEPADPDLDLPVDAFSCDHFRMYEFKVRRCVRGRSHDWTECPYAHLGEKARRRDPRKCHYSGTACPDYRKGGCTKGDACEYSHGVFECWLHPSRYRTQPCKDGPACRRRVCFFAHTPDQLRVLPQHSPKGNGSGLNQLESGSPVRHLVSSPTSVLATPSDSPPMSLSSPRVMSELMDSMRALQLGKIKMGPNCPSWGVQGGSKVALPRAAPLLKPKLCTPSSTPSRMTRSIFGEMDFWYGCLEEPAMERVEFGRDLRTKICAKLSKENSLDLSDSKICAPDVGWVSELVN